MTQLPAIMFDSVDKRVKDIKQEISENDEIVSMLIMSKLVMCLTSLEEEREEKERKFKKTMSYALIKKEALDSWLVMLKIEKQIYTSFNLNKKNPVIFQKLFTKFSNLSLTVLSSHEKLAQEGFIPENKYLRCAEDIKFQYNFLNNVCNAGKQIAEGKDLVIVMN
jgi:HKD family nuclease